MEQRFKYCYRFNRSLMKGGILDNLMLRVVNMPSVMDRSGYKFPDILQC